ncbi:uncharacterized protein LOC144473761 [Augochlora pura]
MISEIRQTTAELNRLEKEHILLRQQLCCNESFLQNERRVSQELRTRLQLAMERIDQLEEEKIRLKIDYSNLLIDHENIIKEHSTLSKEVLSSRTEAAKFKIKTGTLQKSLQRETQRKEKLEKALIEYKNDNDRIIANIDMNIVKISKEHVYLIENGKAIINLNKRLQSFGLCFHAINEKNKAEIKDLQHKLMTISTNESKSLSTNDKLHPEIESLCFKLKELLLETKSKMEESALVEENINKIFQKLTYMYNSI